MNRIWIVVLGCSVLVILLLGRASFGSRARSGHGAFPVKVMKTLDSSKLKEGDTVRGRDSRRLQTGRWHAGAEGIEVHRSRD